jgi:hypothetical protein
MALREIAAKKVGFDNIRELAKKEKKTEGSAGDSVGPAPGKEM